MSRQHYDAENEPTRTEIDALPGKVLLEFGASWCGYCRAVAPQVTKLLAEHPDVQHMQIEDGRGQPLGRSFQVKLWPTLVFMHNGRVVNRLVRPSPEQLRAAFDELREN